MQSASVVLLLSLTAGNRPASGPIAPTARASALQAECCGFESHWVHSNYRSYMRLLVCGSRHWDDFETLSLCLDWFYDAFHASGFCVIEGGAKGADQLAGKWVAVQKRAGRAIEHKVFEADWKRHGRAAGPMRNQVMLDVGKPHAVIAFTPDLSKSIGTANMVHKAQNHRLPVVLVNG